MTDQTDNFPASLLLAELHIQCQLISESFNFLRNVSNQLVENCSGRFDGVNYSPFLIIGHCTICLSGMAAIRKMLFHLDRKDPIIRNRCARLMELLGNPDIPYLSSAMIRNAWEHLDERLDEAIPSTQGRVVSPVYVSSFEPTKEMVTLKRFDPKSFSIWFMDHQIPLLQCETEVKLIFERVHQAFSKLQTTTFSVYPA
jgi:hypothetical protein